MHYLFIVTIVIVTVVIIIAVFFLAMIPLWLFTLGAQFEDDKISLTVPFGKIFMTLCVIIVPLFIGIAIKRWLPKVAKVRASSAGYAFRAGLCMSQ